jgi:hypothetical protein
MERFNIYRPLPDPTTHDKLPMSQYRSSRLENLLSLGAVMKPKDRGIRENFVKVLLAKLMLFGTL